MTNSFKTYYVSQIDGNDTNDGLSKSSAFATLFAINRLTLQPGDRVLLARGSVFEGQFLQIKDSGTKESPIEIGAYLPENCEKFYEEVLPVIAANGQGIWYQDYGTELDSPTHMYQGYVSSAVLLYDAEYIWIHDIEITNSREHHRRNVQCTL